MEITFDFATRDDCLERMVPSDLRMLIAERDQLREKVADYDLIRKLIRLYEDDFDDATQFRPAWVRGLIERIKARQ